MKITEQELEKSPVFLKIKELGLKADEFLIIGSGIMFALGIRDVKDIHDIDIIVNDKGWEKVKNLSKVYINEIGEKHLYLLGKKIEYGIHITVLSIILRICIKEHILLENIHFFLLRIQYATRRVWEERKMQNIYR